MKKALLILTSVLALSACGLFPASHKTPVTQGNSLKTADVQQLQLGMTEEQVKFLVGTPMVVDTFNPNEWRYLFTVKNPDPDTKISEVNQLTLTFNQGQLTKIDQD